MRKLSIVLGALIFVVAALWVLNWVAGKGAAHFARQSIAEQNQDPNHPTEITFSDLRINPALLKVYIDDLKVENASYQATTEGRHATAEVTYRGVARLLNAVVFGEVMEEAVHAHVVLDEARITNWKTDQVITADRILLNFTGSLKQADSLAAFARLPDEPTRLDVALYNTVLDSAMLQPFINFAATERDSIAQFDEIYADFTFQPDSSRIDLAGLQMEGSLMTLDLEEGHLIYAGDSYETLSFKGFTATMDLEVNGQGIRFHSEPGGTQTTLDRLVLRTQAQSKLSSTETESLAPKGEAEVTFDNLGVYGIEDKLPWLVEKILGPLDVGLDPLLVDTLWMNYDYGDVLTVEGGRMRSTFMNAAFNGELNLAADSTSTSHINYARVRLSDFQKPISRVLNLFGFLAGYEPEGDDDALHFQLSGPIDNPDITELDDVE